MLKKTVLMQNAEGLHLRPASKVSEKAITFSSRITMQIGENTYNLKSMLSLLSAQVTTAREVFLICDGPDEEEAMETMEKMLGAEEAPAPETE